MKLKTLLTVANRSLKKMESLYPNHKFSSLEGEINIGIAAKDFDRLCKWLEPSEDFDSKDIVKVCRCKDCIWYKKFRSKEGGLIKNPIVFLCKLDMQPKDPVFFCKYGEPKRCDNEKS